jgi:aspartyl-tRNA(Asn)/glutamyl-tRNA(Gln) amidotransferase subunit A
VGGVVLEQKMGGPDHALHRLSLTETGRLLRSGALSVVALTEHVLEHIRRVNPTIRAFVVTTEAAALNAAERADRELAAGHDAGPLHGIPYAVKDMIDVEGLSTVAQSRLLLGNVAKANATAVERLASAGAILVGKAATYELGIEPRASEGLVFPPALNPHNHERSTGGSSSGPAAAVAAGLVRVALGTDTGGSIRSPAGYCGVVGLKPTYDRVSRDGVYPLAWSMDHVGPIAASVEDAALTLDAISEPGHPPVADGLSRGVGGLRVGYLRTFHAAAGDSEVHAALDRAAEALAAGGADVVEVELPAHDLFESCAEVILQAEAFALHAETLRTRRDTYGSLAYAHLIPGAALSAADLLQAQRVRAVLTNAVTDVFAHCELLLTANVLGTAPRLDRSPSMPATPMRVFPFNLTGHPALALPVGRA